MSCFERSVPPSSFRCQKGGAIGLQLVSFLTQVGITNTNIVAYASIVDDVSCGAHFSPVQQVSCQ